MSDLGQIKKWILDNKKDGLVDSALLAREIVNHGLKPIEIVPKLREEGVILENSKLGKWGVKDP